MGRRIESVERQLAAMQHSDACGLRLKIERDLRNAGIVDLGSLVPIPLPGLRLPPLEE